MKRFACRWRREWRQGGGGRTAAGGLADGAHGRLGRPGPMECGSKRKRSETNHPSSAADWAVVCVALSCVPRGNRFGRVVTRTAGAKTTRWVFGPTHPGLRPPLSRGEIRTANYTKGWASRSGKWLRLPAAVGRRHRARPIAMWERACSRLSARWVASTRAPPPHTPR